MVMILYCLHLSRVTWLDRVWFIEQFVLFRLFPNYQNNAGVAKKYLSIIAHYKARNYEKCQLITSRLYHMMIT